MNDQYNDEERLAELEKMRERLEKLLQEKEIENDFLRKMIELAEEKYGIDFDELKDRD